jgi:glycosyltransferase involved in cell wall biosynthesis
MSRSVAFVGNSAFTMQKFRGEMIKFLAERGFEIFCFAPDYSTDTRAAIVALGGMPVDFTHDRAGISIFGAIASVWTLSKKLSELKVDLVFCYFLKPIIVANIAAKLAKVPLVFSMVEGRGMIFSDAKPLSVKRQVLKLTVSIALGATLRLSNKVFVLNSNDLKFVERLLGAKADRAAQVNGIGLDTDYYAPWCDQENTPMRFIYCGRLLKSKGIEEFVYAARNMKKRGHDAEFVVIGDVDENADSVSHQQMSSWANQGWIDWVGFQADTRPFFHRHAVLVLPTYYPEGLPRSIQEALSLACPVITTAAPGCGEQIIEGVTGFVVESQNPEAIMKKMLYFLHNPKEVVSMGLAGRKYAVTHFQSDTINSIVFEDIEFDRSKPTVNAV